MGVFLLMFSLQPRAPLFALAAGLLMVVNPTELLRFTPGLGLPYGGAMMFLIAASAVFVLSYNLASRLLLLLACALLETAFLHYETILLVSIMAPALLWLRPVKPQRLLWAAAWYLTTFMAFARFAIFFFGGSTYQSNYVRQFSISSLFKYFPLLFKPIFRFLTPLFNQNLFTLLPMVLGIATFVC